MNGDHSDVMNNETTFLNNDTSVNGGTNAANESRIPVPHGLDDQEVKEWLQSLHSVLESSGPQTPAQILHRLPAHPHVSSLDLPFHAHTPYADTTPPPLQ